MPGVETGLGHEDPLEEEMATPAQGSCLEDPTDRGAGRASPQGHKESDTTEVTEHTHTRSVY